MPKAQDWIHAERLKKARLAKGLSHTELAKAVDLDPKTLQNYESGRIRRPARENITKLEQKLGLTEGSLIAQVSAEDPQAERSIVRPGASVAIEPELKRLQTEVSHLRNENAFLRHLLKVFHPTGAFNITDDVVRHLPSHLDSMASVVRYIDVLISQYVDPRISEKGLEKKIEKRMRVYFAYRLQKPVVMTANGERHECLYRFGLSNSRGENWHKGLWVWRDSNINRAYTTNETAFISDTLTAKEDGFPNQPVKGERSVCCVPVKCFGLPVGILGFSSPRKYLGGAEVEATYQKFSEDAAVHIGALYFCYAQQFRKADSPEAAVEQIRAELAACFDASLSRAQL
jgi:transcriptional regulator with XRE-family HTH domain